MVTGTLQTGAGMIPLVDGRLTGEQISFRAGDAQYSGRVDGNTIVGTVAAGGNSRVWQATRLEK